ncbi:reverse transcriptase [Tanacetum coccineum]|uniref:Reverse transcriptase n=1 Tax=Tanacetum coccineum TaxID=301880 RepID=A0ABQ5CYB6_9ASTR
MEYKRWRHDYWLKDHRRLGPKLFSCEVTYVRNLLNNDGDDWDRELLMSLFPSSISNKITACFVSRSRPHTLYWHNGPGGQFSCKSAYYIVLETSEDIMEIIPEETNTFLRAIWKAKGKMSYTSSSSAHKQKKYVIVAALISERDTRVKVLARQLLVDYHKANERRLSTSNEASLRWAKPHNDHIKINCDASWIKESGKAGLGFVAQNESGDVLLSSARVECFASSPLEAEAKAILWATNHANNKGYLKLKRGNMKNLSLTSNTPYPSRKIRRICDCTSLKTTKEQDAIRRIQKKLIRRIQDRVFGFK